MDSCSNIFNFSEDYLDPINSNDEIDHLSDDDILSEILTLKKKLKDKLNDNLLILGHHYQRDDIISFADQKGDSLKLAQIAAQTDKKYIIFCGVHFMAETADILTRNDQMVILPDLNAGCSMADMVNLSQLNLAWNHVTKNNNGKKIVPITYVNSTAEVKSFVGEHGGCICTSSNADKVLKWALEKGDQIFFFPDQHLGRNISFKLGIPLDKMCTFDPNQLNGGVKVDDIKNSKVILWHGFCSVHQGFSKEQITKIKKSSPKTSVIVHPECSFDVVQAADFYGSTAQIIKIIRESKPGSKFAVGTEINLVNRLAQEMPNKKITSLSPYQCLCTTMYRIRPAWLLKSLRAIDFGRPNNIVKVDSNIKENSLLAINRMLEIS